MLGSHKTLGAQHVYDTQLNREVGLLRTVEQEAGLADFGRAVSVEEDIFCRYCQLALRTEEGFALHMRSNPTPVVERLCNSRGAEALILGTANSC